MEHALAIYLSGQFLLGMVPAVARKRRAYATVSVALAGLAMTLAGIGALFVGR